MSRLKKIRDAELTASIQKIVRQLKLKGDKMIFKNDEDFQSLTYDVVEPFRWLVEKTVYRLGNAKNKKLQIQKKHYYKHTKSGMVLLDTELVQKFLEMLEVDFRKTREYARRNGMKKENGLANCSELTIAKLTIQNLSDFGNRKSDEFRI